MKLAWFVLVLTLLLHSRVCECKKGRPQKMKSRWTMVREIQQNLTQLSDKVDELSNPVKIHVHGMDVTDFKLDRHGHVHAQSKERDSHHHHHHHSIEDNENDNKMANNKRIPGRDEKVFEETHDHSHEDPEEKHHHGDKDSQNGGTHVHIHFNIPHLKTSGHEEESGSEEENSSFEESSIMAESYSYAKCHMVQSTIKTRHKIEGFIAMRMKPSQDLEIQVNIRGFHVDRWKRFHADELKGHHAIHVHQYGDLQNGCSSFGGHFNPEGKLHGGRHHTTRHAGDWGNVKVDESGNIRINMTDKQASLFGDHSIIGRGIVIHEQADDLGQKLTKASRTTGDAGGRLACCVVGRSEAFDW